MRWKKLGVVFNPNGDLWWAKTHATCPTPVALPDRIRVFIQCRDGSGVGRIGFVDLNPKDPTRIISAHREPVLDIGLPGTFDENGVFQTCLVRVGQELLMYYVGFELGTKIRYRLLTGLAVSRDDGISFQRVQKTPILERSDEELYFRCGPFVRHEEGRFRMWYIGGSAWTNVDGKDLPIYDVRYMESADGKTWPTSGRVCMPLDEDAYGFGRPYVVRSGSEYEMFYSVRRKSAKGAYRLGHARSTDGLTWRRADDDFGLDVSPTGWDAQALSYSAAIDVQGRRYVLYNGNDFGGTGFGIAVVEG
jgi:predicted GH43/DUF377 family glycosyl hydrolase